MQSPGLLLAPLAPLAPLAVFMFVSSITPGPNNLMLLASGIRFGFGRTVPHLLGITAGLVLLLLVAYAGIGALLLASPWAGRVLSLLCGAYLLWLAVVMLRDRGPAADADAAGRPMRLHEAALFQFVNPKAWAMAAAACALAEKLPLGLPARLGLMLLIGAAVNLPCVSLWALGGRGMRRTLQAPRLRRAFNLAMAVLVAATALWMLPPLPGTPGWSDGAREPPYLPAH